MNLIVRTWSRPTFDSLETLKTFNLSASVERLLAGRLSQVKLNGEMLTLYRQRSWKQNRRMMGSWATRVACINLFITLFDFKLLPASDRLDSICLHLIISLGFLLSAQFMVNQRFRGNAHLIIIPPCLITVAFTGVLGLMAQTPEGFAIYMTMGMTIVFVGITFLQIDLDHAGWLGGLALAIFSSFLLIWPLQNNFEKLQMLVFFVSTVAALLEGRRIQLKYQYQAFLLQLKEELRAADASKRNEKLSSMAYTDRLTEIPNRRYFEEMAETIHAQPEGSLPLALCIFDIDHFKNLNDQLGHLQGDRCLRHVAACLKAHLRSQNDVLARYGGEEFIILLPNTDLAAAQMIAERIRQSVLELAYPNPGAQAGVVTISAGITVTLNPGVKVETLLKEADDALYRAKAGGRNLVCV
jgi:diguanylate cyclase (GGDEF)-like protein